MNSFDSVFECAYEVQPAGAAALSDARSPGRTAMSQGDVDGFIKAENILPILTLFDSSEDSGRSGQRGSSGKGPGSATHEASPERRSGDAGGKGGSDAFLERASGVAEGGGATASAINKYFNRYKRAEGTGARPGGEGSVPDPINAPLDSKPVDSKPVDGTNNDRRVDGADKVKPVEPRPEAPQPRLEDKQPKEKLEHKYTTQEVEKAVQQAKERGLPLVVHVGASWCGPCRQMEAGVWPRIEKEMHGKAVFLHIDADQASQLGGRAGQLAGALKAGVSSYPTIMAINPTDAGNGRVSLDPVKRHAGGMSVDGVKAFLSGVVR